MRSASSVSPRITWRLNTPRGRSEATNSTSGPVDGCALGSDGQHVAFDVEVDALGVDAGQIELHDELVAVAPRVHGHGRRTGHGPEDLLGETIELTERVGTNKHGCLLRLPWRCPPHPRASIYGGDCRSVIP